jgi:hypothetical protein
MAIYTYERDYRDLEGKVSSASNTKKNIESIQDEINGLSWDNIERNSLDQYHVKPGEPFKEIKGVYHNEKNPGAPNSFFSVAALRFEVDQLSGVYCVGTVSLDTTPFSALSTSARIASQSKYEVRLVARDFDTGQQLGSWTLTKGYSVDSNGGLKIVWAYQPLVAGNNVLFMEIKNHAGQQIAANNVAYVNLTAFVINR